MDESALLAVKAEWLPRTLAWSLTIAAELSGTNLDAHQVAVRFCRDYWDWADAMANEPSQIAESKKRTREIESARAQALILLQSDFQLYKWLSYLFGSLFVILFYWMLQ